MQTIDVVAAIIVRDGALLATQRAKGAFAGGWEFPGGKIEPGETPEQALVREIAEELGVAIAVDRHVVTIERDYEAVDKHIHLLCFACHLVEGKLELREHSAFRWLRENELYTVEWLPADIAVLDAILAQGVLDSKSEKKRKISERSYYVMLGNDFAQEGFDDIAIAQLASKHVSSFKLEEPQLFAWREELKTLQPLANLHPDCTIAFEYMIPRMGKRVDAVVLINNCIFIIEFKVGETTFPLDAKNQLLDYCYDLKNFHTESHDRTLFPVLCCTGAPVPQVLYFDSDDSEDGVVYLTNKQTLWVFIHQMVERSTLQDPPLNHDAWVNSPYSPTPTIIEAARALYQSHNVEEITRNEAGLTNINATTEAVNGIIRFSKENNRKSVCFVTGVPGAGKTLVGLNLASDRRAAHQETGEESAVFLSGNGPLIEVLQAALVEDQQQRNASATPPKKQPKHVIEAEVKSFVQGVHLFREEYFITKTPPAEHVAIFDEAQRAWSKDWLSYKMRTRRQNKREVMISEPHALIAYMDRHTDWATIVCLVGGGQEINSGEAGIIEWFRALKQHFPYWDIYVSDQIDSDVYLPGAKLDNVAPRRVVRDDLHLSVDMRSFRNKDVAAFAEAIVMNRPAEARRLYARIRDSYPVYVTRDLAAAKDWVRRETKRPSDRYGVIADSYGQRIRADGIIVPALDFDAVKWFLRGKDEVDSSYYMEIAASEFKIQGLEIDYAVVAWEGDYRYTGTGFSYHRFYGGSWQNVNSTENRRYLRNGYRVLLTRARQGFVIYVPTGSMIDATRKPEYYDGTYQYLLDAGIEELPPIN